MERWERRLNIGAAVFAIAAAGFWFASAYGEVPHMITYLDGAPESDPFFKNVRFSAQMNQYAATLSGLSALCWAFSVLARR
jgi:hypothetical protein